MPSQMHATRIDRAIQLVETITLRVLTLFAILFLIAIAAIMIEIVMRFYGYATLFSAEYSGYIMASIVSWAASYTLLKKSHVRIDFLYIKRTDIVKNRLDLLSIFLFALVAAFLAWSAVNIALESFEFNSTSNTPLRIPMWIPQASWALGFVWLFICTALLMLKAVASWIHGDRTSMARYVGAGETTRI